MTQPVSSSKSPDLKSFVRDVPDFPKPGIVFKDLTPIWKNPEAFRSMVERLAKPYREARVGVVAGIESRGLILGSALAYLLGTGLIPVRKEGKLPWKTVKASYALEYGQAVTELHADAVEPGARVLIVDDLLATGGTAEAAVKLVRQLKGEVMGMAFLVELAFLKGRDRLKPHGVEIFSLLSYETP
ncbi:MAG: adenine phosphoribosyltransferase [Candidatus Omnitrophica bacterium]|nr:adenine phosphoribosyltransferase [Candidatus Omnitrophota bacterium]